MLPNSAIATRLALLPVSSVHVANASKYEWPSHASQGKFLKDYAAAHEALSKLGTQLPLTLYGGSAAASSAFGSLNDYSTQEVSLHDCDAFICYMDCGPCLNRWSHHPKARIPSAAPSEVLNAADLPPAQHVSAANRLELGRAEQIPA